MNNKMKMTAKVAFLAVIAAVVMAGVAMGCGNDPLVRRWVDEQDRAAVAMLQEWAAGRPMEDLAGYAAVIIGNTVYIQARCKDDVVFLRRTLLLFNAGPNPRIETLPALILEKQIRRPGFFSTDSLFSEGR